MEEKKQKKKDPKTNKIKKIFKAALWLQIFYLFLLDLDFLLNYKKLMYI